MRGAGAETSSPDTRRQLTTDKMGLFWVPDWHGRTTTPKMIAAAGWGWKNATTAAAGRLNSYTGQGSPGHGRTFTAAYALHAAVLQ